MDIHNLVLGVRRGNLIILILYFIILESTTHKLIQNMSS